MIANNVERVHEEFPLKFLELIQLLRAARFEDLEMLWSQYRNKPAYRCLQHSNTWLQSKKVGIQVYSLHCHLSGSGSWMLSLPLEVPLLWDSSRRNFWLKTLLLLKQLRLWLHLFTQWQRTPKPSSWLRWVHHKANDPFCNKKGDMKNECQFLSSRPWQQTIK